MFKQVLTDMILPIRKTGRFSFPLHRATSHQRKGKRRFLLSFFLFFAGLFLLFMALEFLFLKRGGESVRPGAVDDDIDSLLVRFGVDKEKVVSFYGEGGVKKEKIRISDVYSLLFFHQSLNHLLQGSGAQIIDGVELSGGKSLSLRVGFGTRVTHLLLVERDAQVAPREVKLALILQNFRRDKDGLLAKVLRSDIPLTLSFLPGTELRYLRKAQEGGKEILVALPLGSPPLRGMRSWEVRQDMEPAQIRVRVRKVLDYFPPARGIDFSFGSPASKDLLPIILKEVGSSCLLVNSQIVKRHWRRESVVLFSEEFIDKKGRREYILAKLRRIAHLGWMKGEAVGVGRLSSETWKVIEEEGPRMQEKGIRFVPISQLLP